MKKGAQNLFLTLKGAFDDRMFNDLDKNLETSNTVIKNDSSQLATRVLHNRQKFPG